MMHKRGFTLVELLVVIIIIGILASVAIPIMSGMTKRAVASEAIVQLGLIRTAERTYYLEHRIYTYTYADLNLRLRAFGSPVSDLDGTYFSENCYTGEGGVDYPNGAGTYLIVCYLGMNGAPAPKHSIPDSWTISSGGSGYIAMDEKGNIYSNVIGLPYPNNQFADGNT